MTFQNLLQTVSLGLICMKGMFLLHLALSSSVCIIIIHDAVVKMVPAFIGHLVEGCNLGTLLVNCVMMLEIIVVLVLNLLIRVPQQP